MIEVGILRISDVCAKNRGKKLSCTFYFNKILILNIFFIYRVLLIFIELLKVKLVLILH